MKAEILQRLRQQAAGAALTTADMPKDASDVDLMRQYLDDIESRLVYNNSDNYRMYSSANFCQGFPNAAIHFHIGRHAKISGWSRPKSLSTLSPPFPSSPLCIPPPSSP